jgi:hypothetical protein
VVRISLSQVERELYTLSLTGSNNFKKMGDPPLRMGRPVEKGSGEEEVKNIL